MPNDYFDFPARPANERFVRFDSVRAEDTNAAFDDVSAGFAKLPALEQVWAGNQNYAVATGSVNVWAIEVRPTVLGTLEDGMTFVVKFPAANTITGPTLNFNGLGAKSIRTGNGELLATGQIAADMIGFVVYHADNDSWMLINPLDTAAIIDSNDEWSLKRFASGGVVQNTDVSDAFEDAINAMNDSEFKVLLLPPVPMYLSRPIPVLLNDHWEIRGAYGATNLYVLNGAEDADLDEMCTIFEVGDMTHSCVRWRISGMFISYLNTPEAQKVALKIRNASSFMVTDLDFAGASGIMQVGDSGMTCIRGEFKNIFGNFNNGADSNYIIRVMRAASINWDNIILSGNMACTAGSLFEIAPDTDTEDIVDTMLLNRVLMQAKSVTNDPEHADGKPYGLVFDDTNGTITNIWVRNSCFDHTRQIGLWWKNLGGERASRNILVEGCRFATNNGRGFYAQRTAATERVRAMRIVNNFFQGAGGYEDGATISTLTRVGTTATLTTATPHGFSTGQVISVVRAELSAYNGEFTITVTGANTFTYTMLSDPGANATITWIDEDGVRHVTGYLYEVVKPIVEITGTGYEACDFIGNKVLDKQAGYDKTYGILNNSDGWNIDLNTVGSNSSDTSGIAVGWGSTNADLTHLRVGEGNRATAGVMTRASYPVWTTPSADRIIGSLGSVLAIETVEAIQTFSTRPSRTRQFALDDVIQSLKDYGIWELLDVLWILASHEESAGLLNLRRPGTVGLGKFGTTTHTVDQGTTGNGTDGYLSPLWTIKEVSDQAWAGYSQDDACMGVYVRTGGSADSQVPFSSPDLSRIVPTNGTNMQARLNSAATVTIGANTAREGHYTVTRSNNTQISGYKDGALVATVASASTPIVTEAADLRILRFGANFYNMQVKAAYIGRSLDATMVGQLHTLLAAYP